jgi:hypothetical protein
VVVDELVAKIVGEAKELTTAEQRSQFLEVQAIHTQRSKVPVQFVVSPLTRVPSHVEARSVRVADKTGRVFEFAPTAAANAKVPDAQAAFWDVKVARPDSRRPPVGPAMMVSWEGSICKECLLIAA